MADEVQSTQPAEGAASAETVQAAGKNKKINRMNAKDLAAKIEDAEKANMTGSKYYKHLLNRKRELGA